MSLVRVWTDVGARKPVPLLARIVEKDGCILTIRYLSEMDDGIWRYEVDTYDIDADSIAERLRTDNEEDCGFRTHGDGFIRVDSDEDYIPDAESDEESSEFSDEDEDEDESESFEADETDSEAESEEDSLDDE